jgi:hypothetical protein
MWQIVTLGSGAAVAAEALEKTKKAAAIAEAPNIARTLVFFIQSLLGVRYTFDSVK